MIRTIDVLPSSNNNVLQPVKNVKKPPFHLSDVALRRITDLSYLILATSAAELKGGPANDRDSIFAALNATTAITLTKNLDDFVALERLLVDCMAAQGALDGVKGIEFPVNLRVAHPVPPPNYLTRYDPTDLAHCDPWAGEPKDTINCFLYVEVDDTASQIEFLDFDAAGIAQMQTFSGGYRAAERLIAGSKPLKIDVEKGQAFVFHPYQPHRTRRGNGNIRISIDFRLRLADPYEALNENWFHPRVPWHRYWRLPDLATRSFAERQQGEFRRLDTEGSEQSIEYRHAALERLARESA